MRKQATVVVNKGSPKLVQFLHLPFSGTPTTGAPWEPERGGGPGRGRCWRGGAGDIGKSANCSSPKGAKSSFGTTGRLEGNNCALSQKTTF